VLLQNYPNPFNPETWIPFQLDSQQEVVLRIYDIYGRLVRQLELGKLPAGFYLQRDRAAYWDGRNNTGESVANGIYFYQLSAGDFSQIKRMVIVK
jgi:flagellar hook assembly protein FlgD